VARSSSRVAKSEMKVALEREGGLYTRRKMNEKEEAVEGVTRTHKDSKDKKLGIGIVDIFRDDR